jgi:hypothetical protein
LEFLAQSLFDAKSGGVEVAQVVGADGLPDPSPEGAISPAKLTDTSPRMMRRATSYSSVTGWMVPAMASFSTNSSTWWGIWDHRSLR